MRSFASLAIVAVASLGAASAATAAVTTVDFTTMTPGLISSFTGGTIALAGGPATNPVANVGNVFGDSTRSLNNGTFYSSTLADYPTSERIVLTFNSLATNISFTFSNYGSGTGSFVRSLDGLGNQIGQTSIDTVQGFSLVTLSDSGVKTLIFSNNSGGQYNWQFGIGQISFGAVPEPQTWALLIAGFGLVGAAQRRRRIATSA